MHGVQSEVFHQTHTQATSKRAVSVHHVELGLIDGMGYSARGPGLINVTTAN